MRRTTLAILAAAFAFTGCTSMNAAATDPSAAPAAPLTYYQDAAPIFASRCASCHDATGHGLIGPNLTDLYQLHGTTRMDIFQTVKGGVPGTAMPAWGEQLPATDVIAAAVYASTLRGQNLPGGKAPQGQRVEAFAP